MFIRKKNILKITFDHYSSRHKIRKFDIFQNVHYQMHSTTITLHLPPLLNIFNQYRPLWSLTATSWSVSATLLLAFFTIFDALKKRLLVLRPRGIPAMQAPIKVETKTRRGINLFRSRDPRLSSKKTTRVFTSNKSNK